MEPPYAEARVDLPFVVGALISQLQKSAKKALNSSSKYLWYWKDLLSMFRLQLEMSFRFRRYFLSNCNPSFGNPSFHMAIVALLPCWA